MAERRQSKHLLSSSWVQEGNCHCLHASTGTRAQRGEQRHTPGLRLPEETVEDGATEPAVTEGSMPMLHAFRRMYSGLTLGRFIRVWKRSAGLSET